MKQKADKMMYNLDLRNVNIIYFYCNNTLIHSEKSVKRVEHFKLQL
jgi:hypothetical protein